jgi:hypothetical protein
MASFAEMRIQRESAYYQTVETLGQKAQKKWQAYESLLCGATDVAKVKEAYDKVKSTLRAIQQASKEFYNGDRKLYKSDLRYLTANEFLEKLKQTRLQTSQPTPSWLPKSKELYASYKTAVLTVNATLSLLKNPGDLPLQALPQLQIDAVRQYNECTAIYQNLQSVLNQGQRASILGADGKPTDRDDGEPTEQFFTLSALTTSLEKTQRNFTDAFVTVLPQAGFLEKGLSIHYGAPMVSERQRTRKSSITALVPHAKTYPRYREIRGDGNCFYTAFVFSLLQSDEGKGAFCAKLQDDELTPNSKHASQDILNKIVSDRHYAKRFWQDNNAMLCLDHYTRHVAADWMRKNPDEIQLPALADAAGLTIEQYLENFVLTMGVEAEDPVKIALSRAFNFPTLSLNLSNGLEAPSHEDQVSLMTLARHGAHYFALFTTST